MHLITWHGSVICLPDAQGAITHQALPLAIDSPAAMEFEASALRGRVQLKHPELGLLQVEPARLPGGVHLFRDGRYICAQGHTRPLAYDRREAGGWETFVPISAEALADLQHILRHRWIVRETRQVIRRAQVRLADGFVLRVGAYEVAVPDGLAAAIDGRNGTGEPVRLVLAGEADTVELVIAEPRASALIETALWPVRRRRTAEILALAAHRHLVGTEPAQEVLERDTRFLMGYWGAAGLSDLLEEVDKRAVDAAPAFSVESVTAEAVAPPLAAETDTTEAEFDDVLMAWALREVTPWLLKPVRREDAYTAFDELNNTKAWACVYDFADSDVTVRPKPVEAAPTGPDAALVTEMLRGRAQTYLDLFRATQRFLPEGFAATLCVGLDDGLHSAHDVPVFCFQKRAEATSILLPDVDLLPGEILTSRENTDTLRYEDKTQTAVFAGSTTGGRITPEVARTCALPRLRAARFFAGHPLVDFRLPHITQFTEGADDILRDYEFCQARRMNWQQQFLHRFILSMDGNGATCSRVAIALNSNSVLLKYNSPHLLYYFGGLQPWQHYIPISEDREVEGVIALETLYPERFKRIAENGRAFAEKFLNAAAVQRYTAIVLQLYARSFADDESGFAGPAIPGHRKSARAAAPTTIVAHIVDRGDVTGQLDAWNGEVGSQLAVEGFAIFLCEDLPAENFVYQVVQADGSLSAPAERDEFCGTRGEALPIHGFCITTSGDFAASYEVIYEAIFVDGRRCDAVTAGAVCKVETLAPMEAFRISIRERAESVGKNVPF
jgi:hypothetical protein